MTIYQQGALTRHALEKKAKSVPQFAGFKPPEVFEMSFGWFQTKKKRGYTDEQAEQFMAGYRAAHELLEQGERH